MENIRTPEEAALRAYRQALLSEMEAGILRRTLEQVQVITRVMRPAEKAEYLDSPAFQSALRQTRKKDKLYRAVAEGPLPEACQAEFEDLAPLISSELALGHEISLPFLRSVRHIRQPLKHALRAVECAEAGQPAAWLRKNAGRLAGRLDPVVSEYLASADLAPLWREEGKKNGSVADILSRTVFRRGLPLKAVDQALPEGSLARWLAREAEKAFPVLQSCGSLRLGEKDTVRSRTEAQAREAREDVLRALSMHYPQKRIRKLLARNPSLKTLQRRKDQSRADRKSLQSALLSAMPEHIRDLYPLARGMRRRFVLHLGPTNSGKTWESIQRLRAARKGIYLGPLRLLAFEQFENLNMEDVPCSLVTGEERIAVPNSRVQSSTIEMADLAERYDFAVIDECQMISDRDRGGAWSAAVLGLCADEIHICASPDAEALLTKIIRDCGDELSVVRHERMTPLEVEETGFHFPSGVRRGDALIVFSRARVHALAAELKQKGYRVSLIYGALPPDVRRNQAESFRRGETDIVVSTDAIAMGMNLPIARVVFMESEKYDGDIVRPLTDSEIRQIAGRAGRFGQYDIGYVNALGFRPTVAGALSRPMPPLTHAVIRFPESLLGLPLPLTEILTRWIGMKDQESFAKASTDRMLSLASRMETPRTDKRLLYDFLCIPFDETDPRLLEIWKIMYHAESLHQRYDVMAELPALLDPEQCTVAMLDRLEGDYRLCDLLYNYARRFLPDPEETLAVIQQRKDLISSGIIHVLSTQKLTGRTCKTCGRRLAWDWPFSLCDPCYQKAYGGGFSPPRGHTSRRRKQR